MFRPVLHRAYTLRVVGCRQTVACYIFTVTTYQREDLEWQVSYCPTSLELNCSCQSLESLGIPCERLIYVLIFLNKSTLPDSVVLNRWRKNAKDFLMLSNDVNCSTWDPSMLCQYDGVVERLKHFTVSLVECRKPQYVRETLEWI